MRARSGQHQQPKSFYLPRSDMAFLDYFLKKIDKLNFTDAHGRDLSCVWPAVPTVTRTRLASYFSAAQVARIERAAQSGDWREVRSNLPELRRELRSCPRRLSPKVVLGEAARIASRVIRPTGFHVVFLEPDGSGKSTVNGLVLDDLRHAFRRGARYHLFPAPGKPDSQPVTDPHGQDARGVVRSALQLGLWWCRYAVDWVKRVWPGRLRSTAIVFDRYYHELLIDPKRYRYGGPLWLARAVGWFVPKPDLCIILDAPTEVLRAHKREISAEAAASGKPYRDFAASLPNAVVVDASEPLDRVVRSATRALLGAMAEEPRRVSVPYCRTSGPKRGPCTARMADLAPTEPSELFSHLLEPGHDGKAKAQYRAYPSRKSARWILPVHPQFRRRGIAGYRPASFGGRFLKALIASGFLRGDPVPVANWPLDLLNRFVGEMLGVEVLVLNLAFGNQKYALRIMGRGGSVLAYAKLAERGAAKRKIAAEHANLERLRSVPKLWKDVCLARSASARSKAASSCLPPRARHIRATLLFTCVRGIPARAISGVSGRAKTVRDFFGPALRRSSTTSRTRQTGYGAAGSRRLCKRSSATFVTCCCRCR